MNGPSPETFLGFPFLDITGLETGPGLDADIAIFGAPHGTPYDPGALSHSADAPAAIRAASARDIPRRDHYDFDIGGQMLSHPSIRVVDCGDVPGDPSDPQGNRDAIRSATKALLDAGACPILLGGDDSVPIPYLQAYAGRGPQLGPLWVVQVDAHLDWRDERGGEPLGWSSTMRRISEMDHVEGMVQIGLRGIGSARAEEVAAARDWGSHLVTAAQIHEQGIEAVTALVPEGAHVIITFDCDGLDPAIMPGVLSRAPGGLSYAQAVSLIAGLARRCKLAGFDLVELAPARDADGLSALTAYRIVANVISGVSSALRPPE